ncbi:MAG: DUF1565 domain-containing protein [Candidatus Methanoperedens sp.]|nr:DUF1565 domain-containing protein [Candidatus Methanoperedens sp.]
MNNLIKFILLTFILLSIYYFLLPAPVSSTYYVARNGNDNGPGTEAQPWRTITKAANTAVAGNTVYIKTGTYNERLIPANPGSPGNYVTFAAYPGEIVTIDGTGVSVPIYNGLVHISNKSYIRISNLRIINSQWAGVWVANDSSYITVEKNYIYNTRSSGILMGNGHHYTADGNEIEKGNSDTTGDTSIQEIISIQYNTDTFEVKNNYVHDGGNPVWGGEGIVAKDGSSNGLIYNNVVSNVMSTGIYIDAYSTTVSNISVYSNRLQNTDNTGIGVSGEVGGTAYDIHIYNNIISGAQVGIRIPSYNDGTVSYLNNIQVINNNIYNNGGTAGGGGVLIGQYPNTHINGLVIRNNIISKNKNYQIAFNSTDSNTGYNIDHNLIDVFKGLSNEIRGKFYIAGDPQFVNPAGGDFHLGNSSPAIDTGSPDGAPNVDFEGNPRPRGAGYDIGAFEYRQ